MTVKENDLKRIYNKIYPIGAYYFSNNNKNPGEIFGGTWEPVENYFLYTVKNMKDDPYGGASTAILSDNMIAPHTHTYSHSHTGNNHVHPSSQDTHSHSIDAHSHSGTVSTHNHTAFSADFGLVNSVPGLMPHIDDTSYTPKMTTHYWFRSSGSPSNEFSVYSYNHTSNSSQLSTIGNGGSTTSGSGGSGSTDSVQLASTSSTGSRQSFSIIPHYKGYYAWYRYA